MADKVYNIIMEGKFDTNIKFSDLQYVLKQAGFSCRIKGDHYIYTKKEIPEIINIQPKGNMAKPYQVKQIRLLFLKYNIQKEK